MTVEQTYFPGGGSNSTPAHHYTEFKYKTYAPIAFRYFRDLFSIQPDDFLVRFYIFFITKNVTFTCFIFCFIYNLITDVHV